MKLNKFLRCKEIYSNERMVKIIFYWVFLVLIILIVVFVIDVKRLLSIFVKFLSKVFNIFRVLLVNTDLNFVFDLFGFWRCYFLRKYVVFYFYFCGDKDV